MLTELAEKYIVDKCPKYNHYYTDMYDNILQSKVKTYENIFEIGIGNDRLMKPLTNQNYRAGASLRMWRDYFINANVYGCDILPEVIFEEERIQTFVCDQSCVKSLTDLMNRIPNPDLIIDDGSHILEHQIISFKTLFPYVKDIYIIEDVMKYDIDKISQLENEYDNCKCILKYHHEKDNRGFVVFQKTNPKLLFCSLSDRPILSEPMFKSLKEYCDRHDYKCVLENNTLTNERYPSWSKILLLQREMKANPNIDTLVWIDDDILITRQDIRFEELIKNYPFEHVLVSADVVYSPFNAGVLVVKNDEATYQFLQQIWDICEEEEFKYFKFNGLWEQDVMVRYCRMISLMNPNQDSPVTIIPHNIIQSFHRDHTLPPDKKWKLGHFAAHFTGMSLEKRIQYRDEVLNYFKN